MCHFAHVPIATNEYVEHAAWYGAYPSKHVCNISQTLILSKVPHHICGALEEEVGGGVLSKAYKNG